MYVSVSWSYPCLPLSLLASSFLLGYFGSIGYAVLLTVSADKMGDTQGVCRRERERVRERDREKERKRRRESKRERERESKREK